MDKSSATRVATSRLRNADLEYIKDIGGELVEQELKNTDFKFRKGEEVCRVLFKTVENFTYCVVRDVVPDQNRPM